MSHPSDGEPRILAPHRKTFEFEQRLRGPADEVFALMCPVRECEWVDGWRPRLVVSSSGFAESGCVFVTPDGVTPSGEPRDAVWLIVLHEPAERRTEMIKVTAGHLVTRLWITVQPAAVPGSSSARIRYEFTALGPEGSAFVDGYSDNSWRAFMATWEGAMNAFFAVADSIKLRVAARTRCIPSPGE